MNSKVYKCCGVPQCDSSSLKNPNKLFVHVPNNKKMRYKWFNLARRNPKDVGLHSHIYFCEDHFDLPNDMDNFMEYHIMGSVAQVRMKPGCIPSKFQCQPDRRKRISDIPERYTQKKQRRALIEECIKESSITTNPLELGETSSGSAAGIENQLETPKRNCEEELNNQNKKLKIHNNNVSNTYCEQASSSNCVKKEILSDSESEDRLVLTEVDDTIPVKQELKHENNAIVKKETLAHHDGEDRKTEFSSDYESKELIKTEADEAIPVKNELIGENENNETENEIILHPDGNDAIEEPANDDDSKLNDINSIDNTVTNGPDSAGTSGLNQRQWRDYCVYGLQCYRKSEAHLKEFSHPGDSDYESDPNDQRPICIYGASCFRKNKDHRKAYKHPRGQQNAQKPTGARTKKKRNDSPKKRNNKVYQDESTEDEYDMDDPFMADSGSEFEVDGVSDDSDSDVSDGTEEEFNRLLKEAKRFTRSKKKDSD